MNGAAVVCYNVENLFDTQDDPATNDDDFLPDGSMQWTPERYGRKLEQLARAITWAGDGPPALVGLEEVENATVVAALAATGSLRRGNYTMAHFDSPDERGIDVALLIRKDFASVLEQVPLPVDLGTDRTRDVLYVLLQLANGEKLHVLVNHWPSRREGAQRSAYKRMAAARTVRHKVDGLLRNDPGAKVLIMGDFNDYPDDGSIRQGLAAACDAHAASQLFDLMCMEQPPGSGSVQYQGQWGFFDQIIVSSALLQGKGITMGAASAYRGADLLFRHPKYGPSPNRTYSGGHYKGGFSDHLPVVAHFQAK